MKKGIDSRGEFIRVFVDLTLKEKFKLLFGCSFHLLVTINRGSDGHLIDTDVTKKIV